jgi:membrane protease YdiL (CAAX protease family)
VAVWAISIWLVFEFLARRLGTFALGSWLGNPRAGDLALSLFAFPIIAWGIACYAASHGIDRQAWGYRWSLQTVAVGALGGLLIIGLLFVTAQVDRALFGQGAAQAAQAQAGFESSTLVMLLLLVVNGVVIPISEELVWRGVVQTALTRAWGLAAGVGVTALAFAFKHVLIDGSLARITTLLAFALVVGLIRARWGTGSSTITHVVANLLASSVFLAASP